MVRRKLLTAISILGLSSSFAAAILIYEYAAFENSYDSFHKNYDHIYRVTTEWNSAVTPGDKRATTVPWSGPGVAEAFPDVIAFTRFMPLSEMTGNNSVIYKNKSISESSFFLADPGFF
jgi:putative ABC transport system permease protein